MTPYVTEFEKGEWMEKIREWLRRLIGKAKKPVKLPGLPIVTGSTAVSSIQLRMTPIDFQKDGTPMDARLYNSLQAYAKERFGGPINFQFYARLWAVEAFEPGSDYAEIVGVTGVRTGAEIPLFHAGDATTEAKEDVADQARQLMFGRLQSYFADCGYRGQTIPVSVDPKDQGLGRWLLGRANVHPTNKYGIVIP